MNIRKIQNLSVSDIPFLEKDDLVKPETLSRLEFLLEDESMNAEPGEARDFYEKLEALFRQYGQELLGSGEIHDRLAAVLWAAMWKAIPAMGPEARKKILSGNLLFSLKHKIDPKVYLEKLFRLYEFGFGPDWEERRKFLYALENNEEKLGGNVMKLKEGAAPPTIKNWLKDYNEHVPITKKRGKFEEINYLHESKNAQALTNEEREMLGQVISVYDWLGSPQVGAVEEKETIKARTVPRIPGVSPAPQVFAPKKEEIIKPAPRVAPKLDIKPVVVPKVETPKPAVPAPVPPRPALKAEAKEAVTPAPVLKRRLPPPPPPPLRKPVAVPPARISQVFEKPKTSFPLNEILASRPVVEERPLTLPHVAPVVKKETLVIRPNPVQKVKMGEEEKGNLYKSTLTEIEKQRREAVGPAAAPASSEVPKKAAAGDARPIGGSPLNAAPRPAPGKQPGFSLNEALIYAGEEEPGAKKTEGLTDDLKDKV